MDNNLQMQIDALRRELADQKKKLDEQEINLANQQEEINVFRIRVETTYKGFMGAVDGTMDIVKKVSDAMDKVTKAYPVDNLWNVN